MNALAPNINALVASVYCKIVLSSNHPRDQIVAFDEELAIDELKLHASV